jgi:transcriptional regulator with XRE-family HTH domain
MKRSWARLIAVKEIKQDFLAMRCGVDKSQISRWKNEDETEFPSHAKLAALIEAMQAWPGVERHEPIEALSHYFGCHSSDINKHAHGSLTKLAGMLALSSGKALQALLDVMSPESAGGQRITEEEQQKELGPVVHKLRFLADELDDRLNGGAR